MFLWNVDMENDNMAWGFQSGMFVTSSATEH